nr:glycosyltransferase [uncultured Sphingomonas sp.]
MKHRISTLVTGSPLVSVVMPSFNHASYIEKAIASVLAQTHNAVQLIVIDDGSTDGSVELLQSLSAKHGFTLICQENAGVCKTLNRGIREAATGEFIALLASDDFWHPDKLRLQLDALAANPGSEFCFSQAIEFSDEKGLRAGRIFPGKCYRGSIVNRVFLRQHVPAGTMLFSRRLYEALGGFDESLSEEDWDFVIRSAAATSFSAVDMALLNYRAHAANTMRTRSSHAIFHQKAKILAKNFPLVKPGTWLAAIGLHFIHDIVLGRLFRR